MLASARRIRLYAGLVGVALTAAIAFGSREPDAAWIVLAAFYPVTHVLELSATVFRNKIAWDVPVKMRAIASTLSLANVGVLVTLDVQRPALFLVAVALGSTVANVLLHRAAQAHLPRAVGTVVPESGVFREALPLGLAALCSQTYFYVDNVFIRALRPEGELGHYNVAVRAMSWTIMLAQYTSLSVLPWLKRRQVAGDLGPALSKLAAPLFALSGLACGLVWPWTHELLELFRPGFGAASASLKWLLCATVAIYAGSMLLTALTALGKNVAMLWIAVLAVALNIGAAYLRPHHTEWREKFGDKDNYLYFTYHARSKSSDTFGPMGPWLTTTDEIPDPNRLTLKSWVKGELYTEDSSSNYMFSVQRCIAEASRFFTFEPGDIMHFGTAGRGIGRFTMGNRSVNLQETDGPIDIEIEGLGRLSNPIAHV